MINNEIIAKAYSSINYVAAVTLFCIGLYALIIKPNLIKKFMGLNIVETSIFLFIISSGFVEGGMAPVYTKDTPVNPVFVNPISQALILTAIVVAVSTTALALSLMIKLYDQCGTLNANKLKELR